jgi:hypothetical protein
VVVLFFFEILIRTILPDRLSDQGGNMNRQ